MLYLLILENINVGSTLTEFRKLHYFGITHYLNSLSASNKRSKAFVISFFFMATLPFSCKVIASVRA